MSPPADDDGSGAPSNFRRCCPVIKLTQGDVPRVALGDFGESRMMEARQSPATLSNQWNINIYIYNSYRISIEYGGSISQNISAMIDMLIIFDRYQALFFDKSDRSVPQCHSEKSARTPKSWTCGIEAPKSSRCAKKEPWNGGKNPRETSFGICFHDILRYFDP